MDGTSHVTQSSAKRCLWLTKMCAFLDFTSKISKIRPKNSLSNRNWGLLSSTHGKMVDMVIWSTQNHPNMEMETATRELIFDRKDILSKDPATSWVKIISAHLFTTGVVPGLASFGRGVASFGTSCLVLRTIMENVNSKRIELQHPKRWHIHSYTTIIWWIDYHSIHQQLFRNDTRAQSICEIMGFIYPATRTRWKFRNFGTSNLASCSNMVVS